MGRPKGSGLGLDCRMTTRVVPAVRDKILAYAAAHGIDRSAAVREILNAWAEGQPTPKAKAKAAR
jgi:hypothetical protein